MLHGLQQKQVLPQQTVVELEECLKERDITTAHPALSEDPTSSAVVQSNGRAASTKPNGIGKLDKRQIEQRIEEDRERHKRLRESIWAVSGEDDVEFEKLWEEGSDIGDDDFVAAEEDAEERKKAVEFG